MAMSLLKAGLDLSINEKEFVTAAIQADFRQDGRKAMQTRPLRITYGRSEGQASAELQLGKTKVLSVVSAEVVPPYPDRPTEGFLNFNVELSPMASISADSSRTSPMLVEIDRIIDRSIRESRAIDVEALCILVGRKVWSIRVDIHVLDDVGNVIDAAVLATMAALQHFRLAEVTVAEENVVVHHSFEKEPGPLPIHFVPICISFALFQEGQLAVLDPTDREESIMEGRISFSLNVHKELCGLHKLGGAPLTVDAMMRWMSIANSKVIEWSEVLADSLSKADEVARQDRLRKIRGTTSVGRTAALLGLAPPPEEGIKAGDVDHLDYAELHVPIKIKENTPAPQPQEDTQEWRMLEKAAEDAEKHRQDEDTEAASAMQVEAEKPSTKKPKAPGKAAAGGGGGGGAKAPTGQMTSTKESSASKDGKKKEAPVAMEVEEGSDSEEEKTVTLKGSEFGATASPAAEADKAPSTGKAKTRPAPVSDAWDDEEDGAVDDLRQAVKKPAGGQKGKKPKITKKR